MHLKSVRLRGFKSFARVTELVLEPGVAVVIGPNGSGKSNLAEAVMWALGEQSPTSLRGGSMQDVIFAGSDGRRASGGAEVELVFDNADGTLPLPTQEVSVGRRVHRDGQTSYSINRASCRLADVVELMSGVGLGRAGHAVIGQGRVEWFLASKPADRRALIEEAAGLGRFKRRRERASLKLRETGRNLERVQDLEREVGSQLTPLRRQASAAEQLRAADAQLAELRGRLVSGRLQVVDGDLATLRAESEAIDEARRSVADRLAGLEAQRASEEERFARALEERERRAQRLLRTRMLGGRLESCARLTEQRLRLLEELVRAGTEERDRLLHELSDGERADDDRWPQEREELEGSVTSAERVHAEAAAALASGRRRLGEARSALSAAEADREGAVLRAARLRERCTALAADAEAAALQILELEREADEQRQAGESLKESVAAAASTAEAAERALSAADRADREARERLTASEVRAHEAAAAVAAAEAERDQLAAALAGQQDIDTEVTGVVERFPGVVAVASSLECDAGYERALGAALARLQSGVEVPAGIDAWELLDALRAAGARMVRLVLGQGAEERPVVEGRGNEGPGEPLSAHIRGAEGRVAAMLAGVQVVDDLRSVPSSFPGVAVTRDGAYYAPRQGEMGLAGGLPTTVLLERRARLTALSARVEALGRDAGAARTRVEEASAAVERASASRHEASRSAEAARETAQRAERESARAEDRLGEIASRLARARREREAQAAENAEAEDEIERLDAVGSEALVRIEELSPPVASAEEELVGLEERQIAALSTLTRARVELEERTAAAERLARERADERRRAEEGRRRLAELDRRLAASPAVEAAARTLWERCTSLQTCAAELAEGIEARAGEESVDRGVLRDLAETEAGLRRQAEELTERRAAGNASLARLEEQRAELAAQLDEAGASLERASFEPPADEDEAAALEVAIERTRRRIERIGPVNPLAEAECAELGERATFLREQRKDLERSLEELDGLIEELTGRIDNGFAEMFAGIQEHFADMVGTLFPGGRGSLYLVEPEAENEPGGVGVEIKPGRKSGKRLTMLSGGERALAAIAFLMALVLANPAPFYILDEIEAALDDVNIGRLVTLLRRYRERTQFIIITHQKRTMEAADILYGVTMGNDGVSHVVSARMAEEEIDREAAESEQRAGGDGMA